MRAHGKDSTVHEIVDWRPFDYVTWHIGTPMGTVARQTAEFTPLENGGTHLSLRCAKPEGGNPVTTALVRTITRLTMAKKLVRERHASKIALERLVAAELAAEGGGRDGGVSVPSFRGARSAGQDLGSGSRSSVAAQSADPLRPFRATET